MPRQAKVEDRKQRILLDLARNGRLSAERISAELGISIATVRRDLNELESEGRLRRTHGGAIPLEPLNYEAFKHDSSFQEQIGQHADEKRQIASVAAELVRESDTIAMTPGTTTTQIVRSLPLKAGLTVVTNTINVPMELSNRSDISVLVIGGFLRGGWFSLVGPSALQQIAHLIVNLVFIGVNGIDTKWGLTCFNPDEAAFNRALIGRAQRRVVVADRSKLGVTATYEFWPIDQIDMLITDGGADDEQIAPFMARGIEVRRA